MGLGRNRTKEEEQQLAEEWGVHSVDKIAAHLGRTRNAVVVRAQRLDLGAHLRSSARIPFNVLLKALGMSGGYTSTLQKYTEAGLKIHMHRVKDCSFRMVDIDEFWKFAEKNKHLIDFSRFERNALGAEPDWVKAKRTEDFKRRCVVKPHNAKWTETEDKELLRLLRAYRYTYPEIADRLHRSEGAIQRRVIDLGIKERPLKADNHNPWTEDQLQTLCQMIKDGSNYEIKDIKKVANIPNGVHSENGGLTDETSATIINISDLFALVKQEDHFRAAVTAFGFLRSGGG